MLDWIRNRNKTPAADRSQAPAPEPNASDSAVQAKVAVAESIEWQRELRSAIGDDAALLALVRGSAPVDVKLAAIGALASEASLKQAEREHRGHDRRIHRLAKQRHLARVALRETEVQAGRLIETAKALVDEPMIPANRLVELHRAWQALDIALLGDPQRTEFETLLAQLTKLTRERGDHALKIERWTAEARRALASVQAACTAAATGAQDRNDLAAASATTHALLEAAPADDDAAALRDSLRSALQTCTQLDQRLAILDELLHPPPAAAPEAVAEVLSSDVTIEAAAMPRDPASSWMQLAPLADAQLGSALDHRFEQWRQVRDQARHTRRTERRVRALDHDRGFRNQRAEALAKALERAEAALAAGHVSDANPHVVEIEKLLHGGASDTSLGSRIDAVQAEYTRLKGWQHWGGGLAREELVLQAEALAAATAGEAATELARLSIRRQSEAIDDLRARWKELDRTGGANSRLPWVRFDAALKTAYRPVAAQLDVQRAARGQNLQARNQLVDALNAVALPELTDLTGLNQTDVAPDWKSQAVALERFQTEWRKLGPLEHTVPHKERNKLVERMSAAVQRIEGPLSEARRGAQLDRERLVARAKSLAAEAGAGTWGRELVGKVRELQAEWQHRASALPLPRAIENDLWARFKADIDAIFNARDAAMSAFDAELKAHGAERAALIERLSAVAADTPSAELKRTLAEVEAQWQRAGPAPRGDAAALDARFRNARDGVRQIMDVSAQRSWQAICDALLAKLALCEEFEHGPAETAKANPALEERWATLPALPAVWEEALARRASMIRMESSGDARNAGSADDLLLELEAAFQLDSPAAFQEARRELKLRALKAALEGRHSAASAPLAPDPLLAAALEHKALDDSQRERLGKVIAALRDRGPTRSD